MIKNKDKDNKVLECIKKFGEEEKYKEICKSLIFTILNPQMILFVDDSSQNKFYEVLRKGLTCKLYRIDGSSKKAVLDMDE